MLKLNQGRNVLYLDNIFIIKKKIVRSSCLKTSHLGLSLNARELVLLFCFVLFCFVLFCFVCLFVCLFVFALFHLDTFYLWGWFVHLF